MACMWMPEYNNWCVDWGLVHRAVRREEDSRFLPLRLRSGCGMTKQKEQATSKKQGQKQIPFEDDRQERQQQSKKDNGKKMRTFSSKLEISDFRMRFAVWNFEMIVYG
jgi:hypothetical protein